MILRQPQTRLDQLTRSPPHVLPGRSRLDLCPHKIKDRLLRMGHPSFHRFVDLLVNSHRTPPDDEEEEETVLQDGKPRRRVIESIAPKSTAQAELDVGDVLKGLLPRRFGPSAVPSESTELEAEGEGAELVDEHVAEDGAGW
jgi:hypothetical protein